MLRAAAAVVLLAASINLAAAQVPPPPHYAPTHWPIRNGTYHIKDFRFGTGETLPDLRLHYVTLGEPRRDAAGHTVNAILLIHGTGGDAHSLLNPVFSDVLFGPGQPLDIKRYFIIFPDEIGHGEASKPSDGLRMKFPRYTYDDMVRATHQMLLEHLHVDHLRLVLGTSMGCMQSFVWGETYPSFVDALMPLACMPMEIAGRNRIFRYMAIQDIRNDPRWQQGNYTQEPVEGLKGATDMLIIAGSAPQQMQKDLPTRRQAEAYFNQRVADIVPHLDADDLIYQFDSSRDYNPEPRLSSITAPVMWINSADDFINPPELDDIAHQLVKRIPHGRFIRIPASLQTYGHGTHTHAAVWKQYLLELLAESARH